MLTVLRIAPNSGQFQILVSFYDEVRWFHKFLEHFNALINIHKTQRVEHHVMYPHNK